MALTHDWTFHLTFINSTVSPVRGNFFQETFFEFGAHVVVGKNKKLKTKKEKLKNKKKEMIYMKSNTKLLSLLNFF